MFEIEQFCADCRQAMKETDQERAVRDVVTRAVADPAALMRDIGELETTDIADYALEALRGSRVQEVLLFGRRGAAQAAFSPKPQAGKLNALINKATPVRGAYTCRPTRRGDLPSCTASPSSRW